MSKQNWQPTRADLENHASSRTAYALIEGATVKTDTPPGESPLYGDQLWRKRLYLEDSQGLDACAVELVGLACSHNHTAVTFNRAGLPLVTIQFTPKELRELADFLERAALYTEQANEDIAVRFSKIQTPVGNRDAGLDPIISREDIYAGEPIVGRASSRESNLLSQSDMKERGY